MNINEYLPINTLELSDIRIRISEDYNNTFGKTFQNVKDLFSSTATTISTLFFQTLDYLSSTWLAIPPLTRFSISLIVFSTGAYGLMHLYANRQRSAPIAVNTVEAEQNNHANEISTGQVIERTAVAANAAEPTVAAIESSEVTAEEEAVSTEEEEDEVTANPDNPSETGAMIRDSEGDESLALEPVTSNLSAEPLTPRIMERLHEAGRIAYSHCPSRRNVLATAAVSYLIYLHLYECYNEA